MARLKLRISSITFSKSDSFRKMPALHTSFLQGTRKPCLKLRRVAACQWRVPCRIYAHFSPEESAINVNERVNAA